MFRNHRKEFKDSYAKTLLAQFVVLLYVSKQNNKLMSLTSEEK